MPRFFFHFQDGPARLTDEEGVRLPDAEAAWYQGVRSAREVMVKGVPLHPGCWIHVEDEKGEPVWDVPFEDLIRVGV
nr:hypothetical protein [uncultured Sphingosinicella sp.]